VRCVTIVLQLYSCILVFYTLAQLIAERLCRVVYMYSLWYSLLFRIGTVCIYSQEMSYIVVGPRRLNRNMPSELDMVTKCCPLCERA
jgi:hypothetical protein